MSFILGLGKLILNFIYIFHKICPLRSKTRFRISIVSRQSDRPSRDIQMLCAELKLAEPGAEIVVCCKTIGSGFFGQIKYVAHLIATQMHLFATSEIVVLDGYCIAASMLKHRKNLIIVQMWHAMGALKKFGYLAVGEVEGYSAPIAKVMRMHKGYDVVFVSSEPCKALLAPAYGCTESIMQVMPLPRTDVITDEKCIEASRAKIYRRYPLLMKKKTILYAPTFRKSETHFVFIDKLASCVDYSRYNLIIKLHPLENYRGEPCGALVDKDFSSIEMLSVADYVITDYSAFMFEAALAQKPLFRYIPDGDDYRGNRGFLMDIDSEFPGPQSKVAQEILDAIEHGCYNMSVVNMFSKKYIYNTSNHTKNMAGYIVGLKGEDSWYTA